MITLTSVSLGSFILPNGLYWSDEFLWSPTAQSTEYTITGAIIVREATKQAGRPITLIGQQDGTNHTVEMSRLALKALYAALVTAGAVFTLTLHDSRQFTVRPLQGESGALKAEPIPICNSFSPADPGDSYVYRISSIKLVSI